MLSIAYITSEYPHIFLPPAGGIGSFVKLMARSLIQKGHKVTIFLCLSDQDKIWYDSDVRIVQIKAVRPSVIAVIKDRLHLARRIEKYIKTFDIDIIEAPDWEGIHAFCNFKIPIITRIHGSVTYFNKLQSLQKPRLLYYLERRALRRSQRVIAVSDFSGNYTKEVFSFRTLNFTTVYNGIDSATFKSKEVVLTKSFDILYFGTLTRKKGVIEFARIFNELTLLNPKARWILIGKDTLDREQQVSTWEVIQGLLSSAAQKQVIYKGVMPYNQMSAEIEKAALCVFPSFAEAFPISWLEAMAMNKPIVASSIGWASESIEDGQSGLLEHPENTKAYALKIQSLLLDKNKADRLGIEARKRVLHYFDQTKLIEKNINIYKNVCAHE